MPQTNHRHLAPYYIFIFNYSIIRVEMKAMENLIQRWRKIKIKSTPLSPFYPWSLWCPWDSNVWTYPRRTSRKPAISFSRPSAPFFRFSQLLPLTPSRAPNDPPLPLAVHYATAETESGNIGTFDWLSRARETKICRKYHSMYLYNFYRHRNSRHDISVRSSTTNEVKWKKLKNKGLKCSHCWIIHK